MLPGRTIEVLQGIDHPLPDTEPSRFTAPSLKPHAQRQPGGRSTRVYIKTRRRGYFRSLVRLR